MDAAVQILIDFALAHADAESLSQRVRLYRAVAAVMPAGEQRRKVMDLADGLEDIERRHRQLMLTFQRDGKDGEL